MAAKVFFSYSHKDEELRDQLEVQLTMLKREGLIDAWHDRRLKAGDELNLEINKNLAESDVILLLVSPDFLASAYCYNIEKAHALKRVQEGTARLISVILRPCEWERTDLSKYIVTPKDGKPITKWPDRDEAFLDVTRSIRKAIEDLDPAVEQPVTHTDNLQISTEERPRSSNLRVSKTFTEADRDRFLLDSFEYIFDFIQGSLNELKTRNSNIDIRVRRVDANRFTATIYKEGRKSSGCTISVSGSFGSSSIHYSVDDSGKSGSYNESVDVESDQQSMYLKPLGMSQVLRGSREDHKLSQAGAAELFWSILIEPLQR